MRIVVTGATGNVGIAVLTALSKDPQVDEVVGLARRLPFLDVDKVRWVSADVAEDDLVPIFAGADVVIHLAWLIQPSRDEPAQWRVNVEGSTRVFEAAAAAGVGAIVHASSVGAYSVGPKDHAVDESYPTHGIPSSPYSRQKAYVERVLDAFEAAHPKVRVVRLRPGLVLQRAAGSEIRRLFLGPFVPSGLMRRRFIPVVPSIPRLVFQAVHSSDVADAFRRAALSSDARGAFNIAGEPVIDADELGRVLGARPVPLPAGAVRALADVTWRLRLQPTDPGWLDLILGVPLMDLTRAKRVLDWAPRRASGDALVELLDGMRDGDGFGTPPLHADTGPEDRLNELAAGVGAVDPGASAT